MLADQGRVPVFVTVRQARVYARRRGWGAVAGGGGVLELGRVQRWLADPGRRRMPSGAVLEAWNFVEDLGRGLGEGHALPRQGAVHGRAYERLFEGEGAVWAADEERAARELVAAGVELWESCPVRMNPPS
ncbi:hypothetical protein ACWCV9_15485 [Streptomyces sp. NPDC001606]